jgi:hypothetical protein
MSEIHILVSATAHFVSVTIQLKPLKQFIQLFVYVYLCSPQLEVYIKGVTLEKCCSASLYSGQFPLEKSYCSLKVNLCKF